MDKNYIKALAKNSQNNSEQLADMTNDGQIAGQVILTQAEYDALTTEQKENGTIYLIREV